SRSRGLQGLLQDSKQLYAEIVLIQFLSPAHCPAGWLANWRSCYTLRRRSLAWSSAQQSCRDLAAGGHLADLHTPEDLIFMASHLLTHNSLLLLWTGLNDQEVALQQTHN
uniref:C-type lectin domain-containing protein n=1 Tax=Myripristis murdjan TaxID=586833 RepID=A0A667YN80_9TELE